MKARKHKQIQQLKEIALLANELVYSESSTTSMHFESWCDAHEEAIVLSRLIEKGDFEAYLDRWISETLAKLRKQLF